MPRPHSSPVAPGPGALGPDTRHEAGPVLGTGAVPPGPSLALHAHASHALGAPCLVPVEPGLFLLRFEVMKVASARAAVVSLMEEGRLRPGDHVVDSSSGIYAWALALACHEFGLGCTIVGSTTVDAALRVQLEILGVHLEQMPPSTSLKMDQDRRVHRVQALLEEHPDWHWMRQYHDPRHLHGYRTLAHQTARHLQDLGFHEATLVAPVGSGASSAGLAEGLREQGMPTDLVGVQPFGSMTFGSENMQDPEMLIAGIGSSIPFENVRHEEYAWIHWVSSTVAKAGTVSLLRDHAAFAGLSSGSAYAVARSIVDGAPVPAACGATVFLAPDTGHRYLDAVFADGARQPDVREFRPHLVALPEDRQGPFPLELPWSCAPWNGRAGRDRPVA